MAAHSQKPAYFFGGFLHQAKPIEKILEQYLTTQIVASGDGSQTIFSEKFGAAYHSVHGAATESQHIFIDAGLRFKAAEQRDIAILEAGFGTGLNAFLAWLFAEKHGLSVRYLGLETHPLPLAQAAAMGYAEHLGVPKREGDFLALHTCDWDKPLALSEHFSFEKRQMPIEFAAFEAEFDLIFFDAFSPQTQPELWDENTLQRMYRALRPAGILVSYCAQGAFRRTLKKVGFAIEKLAGPPGKREMTRAVK